MLSNKQMSAENLIQFSQCLLSRDTINKLVKDSGQSYEMVELRIKTSIEESILTLNLLSPYNLKNKRVLEIGSGVGVLGSFLYHQGIDITLLEPGGTSFLPNKQLFEVVTEFFNIPKNKTILNYAEKYPWSESEKFDVIFSNNTLEHVGNIENTMSKLNELLNEKGLMVHNCPNYFVPYEPHFGVPLIPFFPALTRCFLPSRIVRNDLWKSLNFLTYFKIKRIAKLNKAQVSFFKYQFYNALIRLDSDIMFIERHPMISKIYNLIKRLGVLKLFKWLPPSLSSPMVFEWKKSEDMS